MKHHDMKKFQKTEKITTKNVFFGNFYPLTAKIHGKNAFKVIEFLLSVNNYVKPIILNSSHNI